MHRGEPAEQSDRKVTELLPEEGVMFYTHFPKPLCCLITRKLESNGTFILLHLLRQESQVALWSIPDDMWWYVNMKVLIFKGFNFCLFFYLRWSYFDEEAAAFVWNLQDFGPWEPVDPEFIFVDHETVGANSKHDFNTIQILTHHRRTRNIFIYLICF